MRIDISGFKSAITAVVPELLGDVYASKAVNLETVNGAIVPINGLLANAELETSTLTNSLQRIMFRDNASRLMGGIASEHWVESPLAQDDFDRVYWTRTNGTPMASSYSTFGTSNIALGIDKPVGAITVNTGSSTGDDIRVSSVVFVEVSAWGEVSEPSAPSAVFSIREEGSFIISLPNAPTSGHWVNRMIFLADFAGNYRYFTTVLNTQVSITVALPFDDAVLVEELAQVSDGALNTKPRAGLQGLVQMPGGYLAGYEKNVVCFSKAYLPHAWPVNYEITVDGNIKAISVAASGLVVLTDNKPYLIVGGSPEGMAPIQLDMVEPCFAAKAVVDMGAFVVYPSNDGLLAIAGQDNRNLIDGVFDKDEWRGYVSSQAVACAFNGCYWYFTNNGGFVFDLKTGAFSKHDMSAVAVYADHLNDRIYIVGANGELKTYSRDNPLKLSFEWVSKTYELAGKSAFSCAKISSDAPVDFKIEYLDDGLVTSQYTVTAVPQKAFRLPANRSEKMRFTLLGNNPIKRVQIASTMQELL